ncbi:MAG: efflux RND transporter permease subunit, partial [Bacteroidia bacterium]
MWRAFSGILLRNKPAFIVGVVLVTIFMAYEASRIELSYEFAQILPNTDSTAIEYQNFKKQFGEDGSVMAVGFDAKDFFKVDKFNDWYKLSQDFKNIQGIKDVLSVPTLYVAVKNDSLSKFEFPLLVKGPLKSQAEADSVKARVNNLLFYDGIIYN